MNAEFCEFCFDYGRFAACVCGFSLELDCACKSACASCQAVHKRMGKFFRELLATRPATRSNSPRTRLLAALHEAIVIHRESMKSAEYFLDLLRELSPFDSGERRFRGTILTIAKSFPATKSVADTIAQKLDEFRVERALEVLGEVTATKIKREKQVRALYDFACVAANEIACGRCK